MNIFNYKELDVWKKSFKLTLEIYKITEPYPKYELYGLTSQIRRAAVSIPSNIAEGHSRSGTKEFIHYISMAYGSLSELETQILLSKELGYIEENNMKFILNNISEIGRMLNGLRNSLKVKITA